jgi:hypothetical protein
LEELRLGKPVDTKLALPYLCSSPVNTKNLSANGFGETA